jgi:hypothetical protein
VATSSLGYFVFVGSYVFLIRTMQESILASELEWSQHKKLIDFSARPGGFRRAMVPNLPYFMVQFDHKGEKGYGHVIEGTGNAAEEDENGMDEGEKGGGEFPRYVVSLSFPCFFFLCY